MSIEPSFTSPHDSPGPRTDAYHPEGDATRVGERLGAYKLLEKIGEGGMGEVWVAEQIEPIRRRVALKLIKPGMDSRAVLARFEAERQALAMMDHPHIAKVLDAGTTADRRPYFVMELVKGVPITEFCDARRLSPRQRLELFIPVCHAIQHAHQKGVIHRDIKPTNVLVELHDDRPVPKVIDFGVAKAIGHQLTEKTLYTGFGALVGTPAYMAPEQATFNALDVDTRADVYALGVLLYELLAGSTPFDPERLKAAALDEILRLVREEEPPRPSARLSTSEARASIAAVRQCDPATLAKLVRGELDWVVMKALEKDRIRRYETASSLARDVERYLKDETVEACPPTVGYRLRKFARKHRTGLTWSAAMFLVIAGWGVVSTGQFLSLRHAFEQINEERWAAMEQKKQAETERERAQAAERKALEEKERADREAKLAKAVQDYLVKQMFVAADPYQSKGVKVTLDQIVNRAADAVGTTFADQPEVEVGLRSVLGRTYLRLNKLDAARTQLEAALALRKRLSGPEHPDTLQDQDDYAAVLMYEGKFEEAEKLLRETLATARRVHGDKTPVTISLYNDLGAHLWKQGRPAEAEPFTRRAYELQCELTGPEAEGTLTSLMNLGVQIHEQGRTAEAEPLMVKAMEVQARLFGDKHPGTIAARNNVAMLRLKQGRPREALGLFDQALKGAKAVFPSNHPRVVETTLNAAYVHHQTGDMFQAGLMYGWLVTTLKLEQPDHPILTEAMLFYADALEKQEKWEEAWPHRRDATESLRKLHGPRDRKFLEVKCLTLNNLIERQRWAEAAPVGESLLSAQRDVCGDADAWTQSTRIMLSAAYLGTKRPEQAEGLLRDWLKHEPMLQPPSWKFYSATGMLGEALLDRKRYAEAEPLLLKAYEGLKNYSPRPGPEVVRGIQSALPRLIQLYKEWGKPDQQAKWQHALDAHPPAKSN